MLFSNVNFRPNSGYNWTIWSKHCVARTSQNNSVSIQICLFFESRTDFSTAERLMGRNEKVSFSQSISGKLMIYCFVGRTNGLIVTDVCGMKVFWSFLQQCCCSCCYRQVRLVCHFVSIWHQHNFHGKKFTFHEFVLRLFFLNHCSNVRSKLFLCLFWILCVCDLADWMLRYIRCSHNIECANVICDFCWPTSATKTTAATTIVVTYLIRKTKCLPLV